MLLLNELDLKGKRVFLRVDFNVPLDKTGKISDDSRIRAVLPTLKYLIEQKAKIITASHFGRPKGRFMPGLSLKPIAVRLSKLLGLKVMFIPEVIGDEVERLKHDLKEGNVLLLENLRFYKEERDNDPDFARQLAKGIDYYVNDAFGACHRSHASVVAITRHVKKSVPGFLVSKEIEYLQMMIQSPQKPFVAILGGAKVADKLPVIKSLINKASDILIGGAMAYTFFSAQGLNTGRSIVEEDKKDLTLKLTDKAQEKGVNIFLPSDHIVAEAISSEAKTKTINSFPIPEKSLALDIGPATIKKYSTSIASAKTIFWNGPMGVFEIDQFAQGTIRIAEAVASSRALSIVGGGDSVAAIFKAGVENNISHISTGGGASLEFIANETLPGIEALREKQHDSIQ
jgi:phosphoglycerate kinase